MSEIDAVTLNMELTLPHPASVFGITITGVQPLFLVKHLLHIPDRNILSRVCAKAKCDADQYWVSQLNCPTITFNPILTAAEGSKRRTPTRDEFVEQYFIDKAKIKEHLPLVSFIPHTEETLAKSYALIDDLADRRRREIEFLVAAAPLVTIRPPEHRLVALEQEILSIAARYDLPIGTLSLLTTLSCLYETTSGNPASPGRGVLHPKLGYTSENAHNCLSDLLALEILMVSSSLGLDNTVFITADKSIGHFWQCLKATATSPVAGKATGKIQITNTLLQRIDDHGLARLRDSFPR